MNLPKKPVSAREDQAVPDDLRSFLIQFGKGIGVVSVYGKDHPSVHECAASLFDELQRALKTRKKIILGTFDGALTLNNEPVAIRDASVRSLEKRLLSIKISSLSLVSGITLEELTTLLSALCSPTEDRLKKTLSSGKGLSHVAVKDVRYVAVREGEDVEKSQKRDKAADGREAAGSPDIKVDRILAFLKGEPAAGSSAGEVKDLLSDPEKLGKMILEAAAIRQSPESLADGESMADLIIGCLRRTYSGLRKEEEFRSVQGKASLTKAMMLLEKSVLDKLHAAIGARHPGVDRRILSAVREMEDESRLEMLTAHYFDQRQKMERAEEKIVESIRRKGAEKARDSVAELNIPDGEWSRLLIKAGVSSPAGCSGGGGGGSEGFDMGALAVVLDKLGDLMQIEQSDPEQTRAAVEVTRNSLNAYAERIESRIEELEGQVEIRPRNQKTVESRSGRLSKEELMLEISRLTLTLIQPLTVLNASVEASLRHAEKEEQKELLSLAAESGKRMQSLSKRLIDLTGYPVLK